MSHFLTFVTNENGVVVDPAVRNEIEVLMSPTFGFEQVFLYSHGWWTDATAALNTYNRFSVGFANLLHQGGNVPSVLSVGIHWPSMLSEDRGLVNLLEAASFFTMEKRADDVGETGVYALLLSMVTQRQAQGNNVPLSINLFGHSFGCKVVCSALNRLAKTCGGPNGILNDIKFNVVLVQAAFDDDDLQQGEIYGDILPRIPQLRMLVTRSDLDDALGKAFKIAHGLEFFHPQASKRAMGFFGPSARTVQDFGGCQNVDVGRNFAGVDTRQRRLVCANLTPLHQDVGGDWGASGHRA